MSANSEWQGSCRLCGAGIYATVGTCEDCLRLLKHRRVANNPFVDYARREYGDVTASTIIGFALEDAAHEGRLPAETATKLSIKTGQYTCRTCGLQYWTLQCAIKCCAEMIVVTSAQREFSQMRERTWEENRERANRIESAAKRRDAAVSKIIT